MNAWYNAESYPDPTAGEALSRVLCPEPAAAGVLDERGVLALAEAVAARAAQDYYELLRLPDPDEAVLRERRDLERFFLSGFFRRLTGLNGWAMVCGVRKEAQKK